MKEISRLALKHPDGWLVTCFGVGLVPHAPGTFGSLAALLPAWWLLGQSLAVQGAFIVVGLLVGIAACQRFERRLGSHDHGAMVWDEVIGVWITLFAAPRELWVLAVGFLAFRFFDILKPPPANWADRNIDGGLGVMIDDVIAGVMAWVVLAVVLRYVAPLFG